MLLRGILLALVAGVSGCANGGAAAAPRAVTVAPERLPEGGASGAAAMRVGNAAQLPKTARQALDQALDHYLQGRPGRTAVSVQDLTTGVRYAFHEERSFMLASVAKVDILLALLLRAQREHRQLDAHERALADRMIRFSDNECAHDLYVAIGGQAGLTRTLHRLGVRDTRPGTGRFWGSTRSNPSDQVKVLGVLTDPDGPVSAANRRYALGLMSSVTPNQAWGVSAAGGQVALKNGWLPAEAHGGLWTINSVGRLLVADHELLIAVLSERSPDMPTGIATVERVAGLAVKRFTGARAHVTALGR
ncbi:serine hydrolase [Nonomuraea sp. NEAU-A123]|uniref:serine hydrolase n=1 Tax=Nonomuraea sp. NEAU-A123 TaxID=2839649 RepID=UPI001BE4AE37|nr:hypothetical protein [Nonomuraea sp. NEAU-A123]MBT2228505.1 hypothetical protein [Nonomuraea sp. NEAU-A123]